MANRVCNSFNEGCLSAPLVSLHSLDKEKILKIAAVALIALTSLDVLLRTGSLLIKITAFVHPAAWIVLPTISLIAAGMIYYDYKNQIANFDTPPSEMNFYGLSQNYTIEQLATNIFIQPEGDLSLAALQEKFRQGLFDFRSEILGSIRELFLYDLDELAHHNICPKPFIRDCKLLIEKFDKEKAAFSQEQHKLNRKYLQRSTLQIAQRKDFESFFSSMSGSSNPIDVIIRLAKILRILASGGGAHKEECDLTQDLESNLQEQGYSEEMKPLKEKYEQTLKDIQLEYEAAYRLHYILSANLLHNEIASNL